MSALGILDLEWTAWQGSRDRDWGGPGEEMEIVQIGALRLGDDDGLVETGALEILVRPVINPDLSDYFTDLTGISQASVDRHGIGFADALTGLADFFAGDTVAIHCYGRDQQIIERNCRLNSLANPLDPIPFVDARALLATELGDHFSNMDSSDLPAVMGFAAPGQSHQALDDCRCIAEALRLLRREGKF